MIYLDHAATTPPDPQVFAAMRPYLEAGDGSLAWANSASAHGPGRRAAEAVEQARAQVAALVGAQPGEIIWTSGATESNNLAIKGAIGFNRSAGRPVHLITARTEHRCVVDSCRYLETCGVRVTWLDPQPDGRVAPRQVLDAIAPDTLLVSLMWVNNETGAVQDIEALATALRARGVMFHVDAVQAAGKLPIDLARVPVDLLSLSAHKLNGPKGIGALFVRRRPRARLAPQLHGGGHEQGMRSGTLATHQIVGMGTACALAAQRLSADMPRLATLRERLWQRLRVLPDVLRNGPDPSADPEACAPHILNLSFGGVDGEALRASLPELAVSSGSACSSATAEPSYVLRALGRSDALADASLRFSLGRTTTDDEIDRAADAVLAAVRRLRAIATPVCGRVGATTESTGHPEPPENPFDYPARVWALFCTARRAGEFAPATPGVVDVEAHTPASSSVLGMALRVDGGKIADARFRGLADPYTIAAGAWLAEQLVGRPVAALAAIRAADIVDALEIPEERIHCALMAEDLCDALRAKLEGEDHR